MSEFGLLQARGNLTWEVLNDFVWQYFAKGGADLPNFTPPDWNNITDGGLPLYRNITDPGLRDFARVLHDRWHELRRTSPEEVRDKPDKYSLADVPHPFIVPGGLFREIYYWDSYWVVQGLLVSNMPDTVANMLRNMAHLIYKYGHMPNGNRVYYAKRSQPPLLAMMVDQYRNHPNVNPADALRLIKELLPALEIEHQFWMEKRNVTLVRNGTEHKLNVYKGGMVSPRPEAHREDVETAREGVEGAGLGILSTRRVQRELTVGVYDNATIFANIAAGAESGWDYSTRWLDTEESELYTIRTESIVPVDLNAILCAEENLIADFYALSNNVTRAERYRNLALDRGDAIQAIFWNAEKGMWRDYDLKLNWQRELFRLSDVAPVWTRCNGRSNNVTDSAFLKRLVETQDIKTLTSYPAGFPTSTITSSTGCCQWDLPNAWPKLQLMLIEGFAADPALHDLVRGWAQKWVTTVYTAFLRSGNLYEKGRSMLAHNRDRSSRTQYNPLEVGVPGGGDGYEVQLGFGWTNGGIFRLLELYPTELTSMVAPGSTHPPAIASGTVSSTPVATAFCLVCALLINAGTSLICL